MKIFRKTQKPKTRTRLINEELSETIKSTDSLLIAKHLKQAQKLAQMDFSKLKESTNIKSFLGGMKSDYQKLIDKVDQTLAGPLSEFQSTQDIEEAKTNLADLKRKLNEIENKLSYFKAKFDENAEELKAKVKGWLHGKLILLYVIAGFEVIANYGIYFLLGGGFLSAIAISFISALILFWWAHLTPKYVRKFGGKSHRKQLLVFSLLALPILGLSYGFSSLRITSLIAENPEMADVFISSPLVPTLINFFGYLVACYIVFTYKPTKKEIDTYKKHKQESKAISDLESQRADVLEQINNLRPELQQKLRDHYNFLLLGQQMEDEVQTLYEGCYEELKSDLYLRTNSDCDPIFNGKDKDLPPLKLRYQTINPQKFELCEADLK